MNIVIEHPVDGVYLGNCLGLGFWSKLDPIGLPCAVTFASVADAEAHADAWECGRPEGLRFVPVQADVNGMASIAACVAAGLPGWIDESTPVVNTLPV